MNNIDKKETLYGCIFVEDDPNLDKDLLIQFGKKYLKAMDKIKNLNDKKRYLEGVHDIQINFDGYKVTVNKGKYED